MFGGIIQSVTKNKQLDINKEEEASLKRQKPSKRGTMHVKGGPVGTSSDITSKSGFFAYFECNG
jgi:hypothetical protein